MNFMSCFLNVITIILLHKILNSLNYFLISCMTNENKNIETKVKYFLNIFKHKIYTYPNYYFMFCKIIKFSFYIFFIANILLYNKTNSFINLRFIRSRSSDPMIQ